MHALLTDSLTSDGLFERDAYGELHQPAPSIRPVRTTARVRGVLAPWQIHLVDAFIEQHLAGPIRVGELRAAVTRGTTQFASNFKRTFGVSPRRHILLRRVQTAVDLMTASDTPLSEIALACGFADQPHFTRHFRRVMGATPAAWRRAHRLHRGDTRFDTVAAASYGADSRA